MGERFEKSVRDGMPSAGEARNQYCLNCEAALTDSYCSHCGQKDIPKRQTLGELFTNFISSFWSYESKFFKTAQYLLLKPGFLATEYNDGRRERYYHPARMYVFISFVYFLIFYSFPNAGEQEKVIRSTDNIAYKGYGTTITIDSLQATSLAQYDSIQNTLPLEERDGWLDRFFQEQTIKLSQKYGNDPQGFAQDFSDSFTANFPKIFFILLPIFALTLKLLYLRKDFYYSEHLVFSIYYYNFFFLAGSFYMLFKLSTWLNWLAVAVFLWIGVYLLLGMKKMYKQKWGATVLKYATFLLLFSVSIGIGLMLNLAITLIFI